MHAIPEGNLYVGTSAGEVLHFFQIPPDPNDRAASPTFILASRLQPIFVESTATNGGSFPGVQQILLLPRVGKACVLCNSTVTFYSLPELTPVFDGMNVRNCNWIGGIDEWRWCYQSAVRAGVIPQDATSAQSIASGVCQNSNGNARNSTGLLTTLLNGGAKSYVRRS